ncbi:hypothetical protein D0Z07_1498 [Hyphodiscus hymeniophilus]|uniref:Uncharacterized protein n=1 Tax=Hyphodiscus hymeniophilus TaxID=353542 RepID=A0A9P6VP07_9HELO|nr:hypothetical protein D0Z07_1498 [Hyphodiscus hymeniophilus]
MQLILIILILLRISNSVSVVAPGPRDLPYPTKALEYRGVLGGHDVQLNGTVEDMIAQMQSLHPSTSIDSLFAERTSSNTFHTRQIQIGLNCCPVGSQGWRATTQFDIINGIKHLQSIPILGIDGKSCSRISCSYSSSIWLCNDNDIRVNRLGSEYALYATALIERCGSRDPNGDLVVCGQVFDILGYNIIVREDSC